MLEPTDTNPLRLVYPANAPCSPGLADTYSCSHPTPCTVHRLSLAELPHTPAGTCLSSSYLVLKDTKCPVPLLTVLPNTNNCNFCAASPQMN